MLCTRIEQNALRICKVGEAEASGGVGGGSADRQSISRQQAIY